MPNISDTIKNYAYIIVYDLLYHDERMHKKFDSKFTRKRFAPLLLDISFNHLLEASNHIALYFHQRHYILNVIFRLLVSCYSYLPRYIKKVDDHEMKMNYELKLCSAKDEQTIKNEITLTMAIGHI